MWKASTIAAFFLCWLALARPEPAHANCTTPCTKAQVNTDITTNWPDNTTGSITPALLRSTVQDLLNSYLDVNGSSSFTCSTHQFLTAIATLSSYTCAQPAVSDLSGLPVSVASGGTGDTGTAWTTFTPTLTCGTATFTTTSAKSKTIGKTVFIELDFTITAIGTCANSITYTLPNTPNSGGALIISEIAINGKTGGCRVLAASTTSTCVKADVSAMGVNEHYVGSGVFESQ